MADIVSPLPGIFYRKPAPDKEVFAEVGERVEPGQTIGIIEIMKQFSEVKAGVGGVLTSFAVENEGTVNPGDVLATVEPSE